MSSKTPPLAKGYVSRNADGAFRGAGGHLGVNETVGGTQGQGVNLGGDFGWGGDRGFYGARGNATMSGVSHDPAAEQRSGFWGGIRAYDAGISAYHDSQAGSGELGYRADIVSGEVGYREVDASSGADRGQRVGLAAGAPSAALRWYNQDADGDDRREYGLGLSFPLGPAGVSIDYTTETPVGDLASSFLPGGALINEGFEAVGLEEYAPASLIQRGAEAAWDWGASWFD